MDHSMMLMVVAVPTALVILLVAARIWISAQESSPAPTTGRLAAYQTSFSWAAHFAFGLMALAAMGVAIVPNVRENAWLLGIPLGIVATGIAYTFSRPPLREEAAFSAIDGQSLARSAAVHMLVGAMIAQLVWNLAN